MGRLLSRETTPPVAAAARHDAASRDSEYLRDLAHYLHRRIPDEVADEIVAETAAHLQDQIEAEAVAAASAFGRPQAYARRAAIGAAETAVSRLAYCCGGGLIAAVFAALVAAVPASYAMLAAIMLPLFRLAPWLAATLLILSFAARRSHRRLILGCGVVLLLGSALAAGIYRTTTPTGVWVDLRTLPQTIEVTQRNDHEATRDILLLRAGMRAYAANPPVASGRPPAVPSSLRQGDRYIVPVSKGQWIAFDNMSAFRPSRFEGIGSVRYLPGGYDTLPTFAEAQARWRDAGGVWLRRRQDDHAVLQRRLQDYRSVSSPPTRFDRNFVIWDDLWTIPFTAIVLFADGIASWIGRTVFWQQRRRTHRRRQAAG